MKRHQFEIHNVFFLKACLKAYFFPVLGTLKNFDKIPVLGFSVLEDFEKFQKSPCAVDFFSCICLVLGDFEKFQKCYIDFPPVCRLLGVWRL